MKNCVTFWGIIFCLVLSSGALAQMDRSSEVASLMAELDSSSSARRVKAAKTISRSGLTDPMLYQKVAALLKAGYNDKKGADHIDEMAWLCKALASSGNPEFRPLLEEISTNAPSGKLRRYAKQSNGLIEEYAQRNRVLNATDTWDESLSAEDNRLVNMLNSDNLSLKRDAAKILVRNLDTDEKVYDAAAVALTDMADNISSSTLYVDTMSWLCKALASSGDQKYVEPLAQVMGRTDNGKIKTHAKRALESLGQ